MAFRKHAWYLVGYCHLRNDIRTFRVGRIMSVRLSKERFQIPDDFSVEKYFSASWGVYRGKLTRFKVRFTGEAAVIVKTSQHQQFEEIEELDEGSIIYTTVVAGRVEFIRWVLGFGSEAEILEPATARKEVSRIAESMLRIYTQ
jgi:predicted DNA-binding transcriptional regulator YafY